MNLVLKTWAMKENSGRGGPWSRVMCFALTVGLLAVGGSSKGWSQSLADRLKGVQSGHEGEVSLLLPAWKPVSSATSSMAIPLTKGFIEDGVISGADGDRDAVGTVKDASGTAVTVEVTNLLLHKDPATGKMVPGQPPKRTLSSRIIDVPDLASSHRYMFYLSGSGTEHFPGSNLMGASAEVINQLREGQNSEFDFEAAPNPLAFLGADPKYFVGWNGHSLYKCTLHRVGTTDLSFPVLVNGTRVELPVIHAMCPAGDGAEAHFYFLDQPSNGLVLSKVLGAEDIHDQVTELQFPVNTPEGDSSMEKALAQRKPVQIYGIYFDFNSATIKPESEPVLKQISDIMTKNPDWKLSVAGHTDNIGDLSANQALSERRAAAVKEALVTEYKIAPGRLDTKGHGASSPIESNTTVEGRARNRRVELQRE